MIAITLAGGAARLRGPKARRRGPGGGVSAEDRVAAPARRRVACAETRRNPGYARSGRVLVSEPVGLEDVMNLRRKPRRDGDFRILFAAGSM